MVGIYNCKHVSIPLDIVVGPQVLVGIYNKLFVIRAYNSVVGPQVLVGDYRYFLWQCQFIQGAKGNLEIIKRAMTQQ